MKKFRKSADGNCFQLYRRILHVSNKAEYRRVLRQLMAEVNNDKELALLRIFDSNSEKFCFSQISPEFVGASISNSINEKFHDILKYNLPYETKYIKAVKTMLNIASEINDSKEPDIEMYPLEENMNIPFLKPYRTLFSRQAFKTIVREVARAGRHTLLTLQEETSSNFLSKKIEPGCGLPRPPAAAQGRCDFAGGAKGSCNGAAENFAKAGPNLNKAQYLVMTELGPFLVYLKAQGKEATSAEGAYGKGKGKWHCRCEFEEKSGILCSHLVKVLLHLGLDFMNNIHRRWLIKQHTITNRIRNFKYVGKFSALRSKHKIRVKGYKGINRNHLFGQIEKEYDSDTHSNFNDEDS